MQLTDTLTMRFGCVRRLERTDDQVDRARGDVDRVAESFAMSLLVQGVSPGLSPAPASKRPNPPAARPRCHHAVMTIINEGDLVRITQDSANDAGITTGDVGSVASSAQIDGVETATVYVEGKGEAAFPASALEVVS